MDWIALDRHWIGTGSALDQHWIHEILAAAGRAADWIGTGSVLDRYWIGTGSLLDRTGLGLDRIGSDWIGLDLTGFLIQSRGRPLSSAQQPPGTL